RNGVPAFVDDGDVRRAADDDRTLLEQLREPSPTERVLESTLARAGLLAHHAGERVDRLRRAGRAAGVEEPEAVGDEASAGARRRVREVHVIAEAGTHGPAANDAVFLEIAGRHTAAARVNVLDERSPELPAVQRVRTVLGEHLERAGEVPLDERVTGDEALPVQLVD